MLGLSMAAWLGASSMAPVVGPPAAPPPAVGVTLEWSAPPRCPAAPQVRERLARALADSATDSHGMRARASITEADDGVLTLELQLHRDDGPAGQRTMQATDCDELAAAAVLIVALAIDPEAKLDEVVASAPPSNDPSDPGSVATPVPPPDDRAVPPAPSDDGTKPSPDPATPPLEPALDPTPPPTAAIDPAPPVDATPIDDPEGRPPTPAEPVHVGLRLSAAAGLFVLPRPTAALSLVASTWGRAWRAELGASYWTPVQTSDRGVGGRIQQWTVDARGCGLLRPGPLELPLCGGLDVGAVHGKGVGVSSPRRATSLRLALAAGAALIWRPARARPRVGLWIGGDLLLALVRARFRATPAAPELVYHTPLLGARVGAGVEVRFR